MFIFKIVLLLFLPVHVFRYSGRDRCAHNPMHEINFSDIEVNNNVTYNEGPVRVLDREVKKLRNKEIPLVKIQWKHHDEDEASWELESEIREKFRIHFDTVYLIFQG